MILVTCYLEIFHTRGSNRKTDRGIRRGARINRSFLPLIRMSPTALALVPKSPVDFYCFRIATEPVHGNLDA